MHTLIKFLLLLMVLFSTACASLTEETDETKSWSAERLYQEAKGELDQDNYEIAIGHFEKLEARYPYGRLAAQAQLDIAYAYYRDNEPALALAAAERFTRMHPTHPFVDYAYYLKGLIHFNVKRGMFDWMVNKNVDFSDRDPKTMRDALVAFHDLVRLFPDSRYAPDAHQRIRYLINLMAKYEIHVARYYFKKRAYVAAVNRSKHVLENYRQTPSTEDALGIMSMAYEKMSYPKLVEDTLRILKRNYPKSRYFKKIGRLRGAADAKPS